MSGPKKERAFEKENIHPRNPHRTRYDFGELADIHPGLGDFIRANPYGDHSIDFSDPLAVRCLNQALLKQHYDIVYWDFPDGYLCPPIPGRADYIHYLADLLAENNHHGEVPRGAKIRGLDVGVGASCIYSIIGRCSYGWSFVGSDIDPVSIESSTKIVNNNNCLNGGIDLRLQSNPSDIFQGIFEENEKFDFTVCNPPFHASMEEARAGTLRKVKNLKRLKGKKLKNKDISLNFGGQINELCCEGGEVQYINRMIEQSKVFESYCLYYTTLVAKQSNLDRLKKQLRNIGAKDIRLLEMSQGSKVSRVLAWSFLHEKQRREWTAERWGRS